MSQFNLVKNLVKSFSLLALVVVAASCSKKSNTSKKSSTPTSDSVTTRNVDSSVSGDTVQRLCVKNLDISSDENVVESRLSEFFQVPVSNLQNYPSLCFRVSGIGTFQQGDDPNSSSVKAAVRVEFEDSYGVSALEFNNMQNVFYINATNNSVEVIFMDGAGFLQVKGSGTGSVTLNLRYHNFPSMEDYLSAQLNDIQTKCKNGTYTVAQCLGYNWPSTYWWNQTSYATAKQQQLDLAHQILNSSTKSKSLGSAVMNRTEFMTR